jgi:hypothetical protein
VLPARLRNKVKATQKYVIFYSLHWPHTQNTDLTFLIMQAKKTTSHRPCLQWILYLDAANFYEFELYLLIVF